MGHQHLQLVQAHLWLRVMNFRSLDLIFLWRRRHYKLRFRAFPSAMCFHHVNKLALLETFTNTGRTSTGGLVFAARELHLCGKYGQNRVSRGEGAGGDVWGQNSVSANLRRCLLGYRVRGRGRGGAVHIFPIGIFFLERRCLCIFHWAIYSAHTFPYMY